jgi:hypothetical protein
MKRLIIAATLALTLGACSTLDTINTIQQVATATVPASVVIPAANAFNILKGTAVNYGRYCIANKMPEPICSASNRRIVIKFVRSGTSARNQLEGSLATGQPAAASVYNTLVAAIQGLKGTPVTSQQFGALQ